MCNCGCDPSTQDEANKLRKKAAVTGGAVACLAAIPAVVNSPQHPHPAVMWAVIAVQVLLLVRAALLLRKRKQLLAGA
ncbi:hypothetical protein [Terriglobus sp. ADX1]|uniref:hypothetical protein n=1 Tax=Terriglobus sp. ADX1 TaxID=2794063 RepID=UPI002FE650BC